MKLSVITPVHNSFSLMGRYFHSLENQSYRNFEIIIIDDCSSDNSYQKLLEYKRNSHLDIKVIKNKENTGPGIARNIGIDHVSGDYIIFIDSDDYIDHECFFQINNTIQGRDIDCLIFDYFRQRNDYKTYGSSVPNFSEGFLNVNKAVAISTGSTCCKLYKTEIIKSKKIHFPNLMRFEDTVFNKLSLINCKNIYYLKKPLYYYVNNDKSIVNNVKNKSEKFAISAFKILEKELKEEHSNELEAIFARELLYTSVLTMISNGLGNKKILSHIKNWEKRYPNWYENKNIKHFSLHQKLALMFINHKFLTGLRLLSYLRDKNILFKIENKWMRKSYE